MKRLSDLDIGESGDILCVTAAGGMRRRLMDLGFTMGARAECLFAAPGKGMRAYRVREAVVALRRKDAATVLLREAAHG